MSCRIKAACDEWSPIHFSGIINPGKWLKKINYLFKQRIEFHSYIKQIKIFDNIWIEIMQEMYVIHGRVIKFFNLSNTFRFSGLVQDFGMT